jgi:hypothetical protein
MTAEFVASSCLFLSDRFGVSFCLYEVRAYVIILSLHEWQACGRTQFCTIVSPHLSRNLETLKQTSSTLCRKIILPDDTLYLPSIFCCQKYQHSGRENIWGGVYVVLLKATSKNMYILLRSVCRMKNDMASGWIDTINEPWQLCVKYL